MDQELYRPPNPEEITQLKKYIQRKELQLASAESLACRIQTPLLDVQVLHSRLYLAKAALKKMEEDFKSSLSDIDAFILAKTDLERVINEHTGLIQHLNLKIQSEPEFKPLLDYTRHCLDDDQKRLDRLTKCIEILESMQPSSQ